MRKWTLLCILLLLMLVSGCQTNKEQEKETVGGVTVTSTPTPAVTPTPEPTITPTPVITLSVPVTYRPVEPKAEGLTEIQCSEGEGIELDLNGDGAPEQIYTAEEGIYINGILQVQDYRWEFRYRPFDPDYRQIWEKYWITDVDKEDGYYNLIFSVPFAYGAEALTFYDGALHDILVMGAYGEEFSEAEYFGDGTFRVKGVPWHSIISYSPDITYHWSKETGIMQLEEFLPLKNPCPLELLETTEMYTDHNMDSITISVEPQTVYMLCSSVNWVQFCLEDGTEVWIYAEYVEGKSWVINGEKRLYEIFSGFPTAG